MSAAEYKRKTWFALLVSRCESTPRAKVARQLGVSPATVSQVLNGSGLYGSGQASTEHIAERVVHTFGRYPCPYLTEEAGGVEQVILLRNAALMHTGLPQPDHPAICSTGKPAASAPTPNTARHLRHGKSSHANQTCAVRPIRH